MVRRLVAERPEKDQSCWVSVAPTTRKKRNGLGKMFLAASLERLLSNINTINQVSSGLSPCHPLM
ncbi:MAG: hypothetical protein GDA43_25115 [Hormoscilla sp. SP5CHS1]|nr:hypothetical protein [Hormoscilla sp. SP12CHS1]MBC6456055.1 hypothetical protein [Hormoscilla sp. SP5CHS1]